MIKKIIVFSENNAYKFNFIKSASSLRLTYMLRSIGYTVKQVHNCTSFDRNELEYILDSFSKGDDILVCISTSFLNRNKSYSWDDIISKFLLTITSLCDSRGIKIIVGGWQIQKNEFHNPVYRNGLLIDHLDKYVTLYTQGDDINIIDSLCREESVEYETIKTSRVATTNIIRDYSDCAFTPLPEDHISEEESLTTELAAGCIFSCQYCNYAALGKKKTEFMRSYESVKKEIVSNYKNFKTRVYMLTDNIVNDYYGKLEYLVRIKDETGIDLRWVGYVRLDTITKPEHAKLLFESGIAGASFGIESFKKESGPSVGKMTDKHRLLSSLELFRASVGDSCLTTGLFIAGLPQETKKELYQTYEWLISDEGRYYIDNYSFNPLMIFQQNNDKNNINKSRHDPFSEYIKGKTRFDWTSPWGNSQEFTALSKHFMKNKKTQIGTFSLPVYQNLDIPIENLIKIVRDRNYVEEEIAFKNMEKVVTIKKQKYIKQMLA